MKNYEKSDLLKGGERREKFRIRVKTLSISSYLMLTFELFKCFT